MKILRENKTVCPSYDIASLSLLRLQITNIIAVKYFYHLLAFYTEMKH